MKKDFALQLEGCSKADRKKVIKAAKSAGLNWQDNDRFKTDKFGYFVAVENKMRYQYGDLSFRVVYQMPQDWSLIQEALGIEVEPEYIKLTESEADHVWHYGMVGEIFKTIGYTPATEWVDDEMTEAFYSIGEKKVIAECRCEPSTKQAYEAQEAKKVIASITLGNANSEKDIKIYDLAKENKKLTERITDLEGESLGYKKLLEKREGENERLKELNDYQAKRLIEVEENNGKLYDMADKARKENRRLFKKILNV